MHLRIEVTTIFSAYQAPVSSQTSFHLHNSSLHSYFYLPFAKEDRLRVVRGTFEQGAQLVWGRWDMSSPVWCYIPRFLECSFCDCSWSRCGVLLISIFGFGQTPATRRHCSFLSTALLDLESFCLFVCLRESMLYWEEHCTRAILHMMFRKAHIEDQLEWGSSGKLLPLRARALPTIFLKATVVCQDRVSQGCLPVFYTEHFL